ncbi:zinc ribbon domain-containing protein [Acetivibrio cellulolyticus]|uniref:zinc ribbon domain-containing protein n=1 Tax=Acetivibrio cellulolyticus TaxID=35830 RepID=UPI0001E2BDD3|nr:zinc ribbon domain-containing protein [Acetivibrio cellulolyticus]
MNSRICPNCGEQNVSSVLYCSTCGTSLKDPEVDNPINEKERDCEKRLSVKKKIGIGIVVSVLLITIICIVQANTINQVKTLYNQGKYYEAQEKAGGVFITNDIKDINDKLEVLGYASFYLNSGREAEFTTDDRKSIYASNLFTALEKCIGYFEQATATGCYNELNKIKQESLRILLKSGYSETDIKDNLKWKIEHDKYAFYPLSFDNRDEVDKQIDQLFTKTLKDEAKKIENDLNPLRIEKASMTTEGDYTYYTGSIKNYSDNIYKFVQVRVVYMDINKEVLTTDTSYAVGSEGIRPNENVQFEVMTKVRGDVKYGNIEIMDYNRRCNSMDG